MKKLIIIIALCVLMPSLGFGWGKKGSKWHYGTFKDPKTKKAMTAVWESMADTTFQGKKCHLFVKHYVDSTDKKITPDFSKFTNLKKDRDTLYSYASTDGDSFFRWVPRLKSWNIHYSATGYIPNGVIELMGIRNFQDSNIYDSMITRIKVWGSNISLIRFNKKNYLSNTMTVKFNSADNNNIKLEVIKDIGNINCFLIEEGIEFYSGYGYYLPASPLLCYYEAETGKTYYKDSIPNCFSVYTGIKEDGKQASQMEDIRIYPVPTSNILNVSSELNLQNKIYRIIDFQGRVLRNERLISNAIDVSGLQQGLYLLDIEGRRLRFVKE